MPGLGLGQLLRDVGPEGAQAHLEGGAWSIRRHPQRSSFQEASGGAPPPKEGLKKVEKVSQNVGCAPGFRCMSKISEFGMEHNGEYKRVTTPKLPARFEQRDVWEWGCPARGNMTSTGKCHPPKPGEEAEAGMCWSQNAMLAGPKTPCGTSGDKCMCVKPVTSDGSIGYGYRSRDILPEFTEGDSSDAGGVEVVMGNFQVQPLPHCDDCLALSSNWEQCSECANCAYGTKDLEGRPTLACFDKDFQPPGAAADAAEMPQAGEEYRKKNFVLLQGKRAEEQDLWTIPQYPLWDPEPDGMEAEDANGGQVFPFQINTEPLSNEAWVKAYKTAAPRIQSLMDTIAKKLKTHWGPGAPTEECSQLFEARYVKAQSARKMCKEMQTLQATLAPGELGTFPRRSPSSGELRCEFHRKDTCDRLNCYSHDDGYAQAVGDLRKRDGECKLEREAELEREHDHQAKTSSPAAKGALSVKDLMKEEEMPLVPEDKDGVKKVQQVIPPAALVLAPPGWKRKTRRRAGDFLGDATMLLESALCRGR